MSKLFYAAMIVIAFVFGILLYTNYISFVNRDAVDIKSPYSLSVKPKLVTYNAHAQISIIPLNGKTPNNVLLLVVDPDSKRLTPKDQYQRNSYSFPEDFAGATSSIGNYTVLLTDSTNNKILASVNFQIRDWLPTIASFILSQGLGFFFGMIGPLVTIFLERASKLREDNLRRLQEKSKWMDDNMNSYVELYRCTGNITNLFKVRWDKSDQKYRFTKLPTPQSLFEELVQFRVASNKFEDSLQAIYYFDDIKAEDFIARLDNRVMKYWLPRIFLNLDFIGFTKKSVNHDLKKMMGYQKYVDCLNIWLNPIPLPASHKALSGVMDSYLCVLLYGWALRVNVNNAAIVTYSSPREVKNEFRFLVKDYEFEHLLRPVNRGLYGNDKSRYYQPLDWLGPYHAPLFQRIGEYFGSWKYKYFGGRSQ